MKKVEWEELEHLGGSKDDVYVRMLKEFSSSYGYKKGDLRRLELRENRKPIKCGDDFYRVQRKEDVEEEERYREDCGPEYDGLWFRSGACAYSYEFEVVWNPLNIDIEDTVH